MGVIWCPVCGEMPKSAGIAQDLVDSLTHASSRAGSTTVPPSQNSDHTHSTQPPQTDRRIRLVAESNSRRNYKGCAWSAVARIEIP